MQKKIIALAIAGLSGAAFAQSNVTIYGVVDQALDMGNHGNGSKSRMVGSGYMTERIGFKGEEALGNGLTAFFNLEAGLGSNNGTVGGVTSTNGVAPTPATVAANPAGIASVAQVFSREAKVGIKGKFGEVAVGRLYSPWFSAWAGSDVFSVAGAGSNYSLQRNQTTRINNAMMYSTPAMGGFGASLMYGTGDVGGAGTASSAGPLMASVGGADGTPRLNKNVGRHVGLNLRYGNGPVSVAYGYAKTDQVYDTTGTGTVAYVGTATNPAVLKQNTLSGSYDLGMVKLFANWSTNQNDVAVKTIDNRTWSLALSAPVGAGVVKFQYGKVDDKLAVDQDTSLTAIGYHYGLSKRTTVYTTYAKVKNTNGSTTSYLGDGGTGSGASGATGSGVNAAGVANGNFGPSTLQAGISHSF